MRIESTEHVLDNPAIQRPEAAPNPAMRHRDATNIPKRQYRAFMLMPTANVRNDVMAIPP